MPVFPPSLRLKEPQTKPASFGNFWLTIQNTASRQVRNLFYLVAVFILFPLARAAAAVAAADFRCCCAPRPTPPPFVGGGKCQKKKIACSVGVGAWTCLRQRRRGEGHGVVKASYERYLSGKETVYHGR